MTTIAKLNRQAPVGKVVGGDLYIHTSAATTLPRGLRAHVDEATELAEEQIKEIDEVTLVKIGRAGALVSFLDYEDFDQNPHPPLKASITVNLDNGRVRLARYRSNRPILHRKETFVDEDYPGYETFSALTDAEEDAGLLGRSDIGREDQWASILKGAGLAIEGHELFSLR